MWCASWTEENELSHLEPIDVARGLVAIHDRLPPWTGRTQHLSRNAKRIRQLFKQAKDPNRLIFDDIPKVLDDTQVFGEEEAMQRIAGQVREGLMELTAGLSGDAQPYEGNAAGGVAGAECLAGAAGGTARTARRIFVSLAETIAWKPLSFALRGSKEA